MAEFGVFYYQRPSEAKGGTFSITENRFPVVKGDGGLLFALAMTIFVSNVVILRRAEIPVIGIVWFSRRA